VIPFRNVQRDDSIRTVINNIRAQRFPSIDIIVVEQDAANMVDINRYKPVTYYLAAETVNKLFNKSKAFNHAVSKVPTTSVILHDADILVQSHYTQAVYDLLAIHEACHLGKSVVYADDLSTAAINANGIVDANVKCDRVVGYFEGGSLACRTAAFWRAGGFNEDFWGYGCEDCDFYARLSHSSSWKEDRVFDFLHLWHSRVSGWNQHHETNRRLEAKLRTHEMPERIAIQRRQMRAAGYGHLVGGEAAR
jgi:predicted glycosyltransferase involved in capsule biosynthesis